MLIMGKAVLVRVGREGEYGNSLYPPLSFVVNLILFLKKIKKKKATQTEWEHHLELLT